MLEKEEVVAEKVRFEETLEGPEELTVWKSGESVPGRKQPVQRKAQRWEQQRGQYSLCLLPVRPLEALDLTKSPLVAQKMNQPIVDHHLHSILAEVWCCPLTIRWGNIGQTLPFMSVTPTFFQEQKLWNCLYLVPLHCHQILLDLSSQVSQSSPSYLFLHQHSNPAVHCKADSIKYLCVPVWRTQASQSWQFKGISAPRTSLEESCCLQLASLNVVPVPCKPSWICCWSLWNAEWFWKSFLMGLRTG